MRKQVFVNEEKRTVVVVLNNKANGICVRGKAICHETDIFNAELGTSIANTRAWQKYYEALIKETERDLTWSNKIVESWTKHVEKLQYTKDLAERKIAEITAEYEEIIKNI